MKRIKGIAPAVLTPFDKSGKIDKEALGVHCDFLINAGVHALYILGTTAEVFLLNMEERKQVAELVVNHVNGRIPVFVQVGDIRTEAACELAKHAQSIGADGVGAVTPYYFHVDQRGLTVYYETIAKSVRDDFPVYLYNIPSCTTNDLLPDTVGKLAQIDNVIGIKNSMGDLGRITELVAVAPQGFDVIQGADTLLFPGLMCGAVGSVSGNANVFPEVVVGLYESVVKGDYARARVYHQLIQVVAKVLKNGADLAFFKQALEFRGFRKTYTRAPLLDVDDSQRSTLKEQIESLMVKVRSL